LDTGGIGIKFIAQKVLKKEVEKWFLRGKMFILVMCVIGSREGRIKFYRMKKILVCLLASLAFSAKGQLYVINDPDGYTNVREGKGVNTKIVGRLFADDVFLCSIEGGDQWASIYYNPEAEGMGTVEKGYYLKSIGWSKGILYIHGYIPKDRLVQIDVLPHIPAGGGARIRKDNELLVHNDSVRVLLTTAPFLVKGHILTKDENGFVQKIDGREPHGTDGELPHTKLTGLTLTLNGKAVVIPASAYSDVYEPEVGNFNVFFDRKGHIYLYMPDNSDGGGAYHIVWVVKEGKYLKRYIDRD
jgi:hypothetical protein